MTLKVFKDISFRVLSVAYISKLETNTKIEYIEVVRDSIVYVNNNPNDIIASFNYNDKWLNIRGQNNIKLGENFECNTLLNEAISFTPNLSTISFKIIESYTLDK